MSLGTSYIEDKSEEVNLYFESSVTDFKRNSVLIVDDEPGIRSF